MGPLAVALLVLAAGVAIADWVSVWRGVVRTRPLTKSLTLVLLVGVALAVDPAPGLGGARAAVVAAAGLSLVGDVLLLPQVDVFEGGLGAFLLAHVAYVVAFVRMGLRPTALAPLTALVLVVLLAPVLRRILRAVRAGEPVLVVPVLVYVAAICTMAGAAVATRRPQVIVGALVFVASDAQLAWHRFVRADRRLDLGVIATYHIAQALLVTSVA